MSAFPQFGSSAPLTGRKDVVVVDDEAFVFEVYGGILDIDRYSYDLCNSGRQALELVEGGSRYNVALISTGVAGLSASDTAKRLSDLDPALKVAFVANAADSSTLEEEGAQILLKPFTPKDVRTLIRRLRRGEAG